MPVNFFDPADWLKILVYGAALSIPVVLVIGLIWKLIKEADASKAIAKRGFEVKSNRR